MNVIPEVKERMLAIGELIKTVEIPEEFWDAKAPHWQNTNNHVWLIMRSTYVRMETDEEIRTLFLPVLEKQIWLFVTHPEWRARISWMTWFLQLYVFDKQFAKETGVDTTLRYSPEIWTDPRKWGLAEQVGPMEVTADEMERKNDGIGGLGTAGTH